MKVKKENKEKMKEINLVYVQVNKEIWKQIRIEAIKKDITAKEMLHDALDFWLITTT